MSTVPASVPNPSRLSLPDVTLLCVNTRTPALALAAMQRCMAQIDFGDALLFTDPMQVDELPPGIHVRGARIDSDSDYSKFMLTGLAPYVSTRHALVMQWDAFVVDASCWDPDFLLYDYIGAPWRDQPAHSAVGSGGFSLRSRRLLMALREAPLSQPHPEDLSICVENRERLERQHDIRIAPIDVARRFAFGRTAASASTFGFHGLHNLHRVLRPCELVALLKQLPDEAVCSDDALELCRALIRRRRVDVADLLLARRNQLGLRDRDDLMLKFARAWAARLPARSVDP